MNQLSVFLENRKGQLSEVTDLLAENKINLRALNIAETADYGVLRIIVDDARYAARVLSEKNFIVNPTVVTVVAVPDEPGGLAKLLKILSDNDIDVEYMYSIFGNNDGMALMAFRVNNHENMIEILQKNGIYVASNDDLGINK